LPSSDKDTPFALYQARNAMAIASAAGAQTYAADAFAKAQNELAQAENPKEGRKEKIRAAREATQSAEDARLIAVKRQESQARENERKQAQAAIDLANQQAAQAQAAAEQAQAAAIQAKSEAVQVQKENTDLRSQLLEQLNAVIQTRATARGLIVNLASGISFKTGHWDLLPAARDYLVSQGVAINNIVSRGLGKSNPIDTNDTASGRQSNRRVELVVSGTGITVAP
jgi:flagellar motor protein MotB